MSNVIEKFTKIIKDDSGISEIIDKKLTREASDKILYIEARLQAINEIASNSCSDVKDADNIISFCNEIRDAVANVPDTKVWKWIPVSTEQVPDSDRYILLSFENYSVCAVGRYEDGAFYVGDEDTSLSSIGVFVNAWTELLKRYEESEE